VRARVASEEAVEVLRVSVTDTGIGISDEDQLRLFRPFEQVDSSSQRAHEGTGLGLALTRRLVELHGGRVSARSGPTGGAVLRIELPAG
jgi:signal transduction histidine kinase